MDRNVAISRSSVWNHILMTSQILMIKLHFLRWATPSLKLCLCSFPHDSARTSPQLSGIIVFRVFSSIGTPPFPRCISILPGMVKIFHWRFCRTGQKIPTDTEKSFVQIVKSYNTQAFTILSVSSTYFSASFCFSP